MPFPVDVDQLAGLAAQAGELGRADAFSDLSKAWDEVRQVAVARMRLRAAATGRPADRKVVATLNVTVTRDGLTTQIGRGLPWWGGATFGAQHGRRRPGRKNGYVGFNQFPRRRVGAQTWPYAGLDDAAEQTADAIETEIDRQLAETL
jgi:hypothetical protein